MGNAFLIVSFKLRSREQRRASIRLVTSSKGSLLLQSSLRSLKLVSSPRHSILLIEFFIKSNHSRLRKDFRSPIPLGRTVFAGINSCDKWGKLTISDGMLNSSDVCSSIVSKCHIPPSWLGSTNLTSCEIFKYLSRENPQIPVRSTLFPLHLRGNSRSRTRTYLNSKDEGLKLFLKNAAERTCDSDLLFDAGITPSSSSA
ncbi:Os12g0194266 [Oryza sativa Japonica Group]|uniref:Os12g0194266 protein n=1 Tax=Oryza sativa subsp. japonica TaxID=39947 RepID=A0A0N7KTP9_ORYSJ|nr:hypothetical protein EE612_058277 [Oryza sativa]BAT16226.1 Os12g0194266 [Oryza sativa Japonica Group]